MTQIAAGVLDIVADLLAEGFGGQWLQFRGLESVTRDRDRFDFEDYLRLSLRGFRKEGKSYAPIAIGCTGGRHRSVAVVNELAARLEAEFPVLRRHRDINRARLS